MGWAAELGGWVPTWDEFRAELVHVPTAEEDVYPPQCVLAASKTPPPWLCCPLYLLWNGAVSVYIAGISALVRWRDRRAAHLTAPLQLRAVLLFWNSSLTVYSLAGAAICVPVLLLHEESGLVTRGFYASVCSPALTYGSGWSGKFVQLFIYSKFVELLDTVWLALKGVPLTTLHLWHHITVLLYCWHSYAVRIGTGLWFAAMNYVVHSVMYGYFGLTQLSPRWRKAIKPYAIAITLLQLAQMVVGIVVTVASIMYVTSGYECHVQKTNSILGLAMYTSYFILFFDFYVRTYCKQAVSQKDKDR